MSNINTLEAIPAVQTLNQETAASYSGGCSGRRIGIRDSKSTVMLFEDELFGGKSLKLKASISNLKNFDNITSSLKVRRGRWALYEEPNYQGRYVIVGPGQYPILPVMDNQVSSLKRLG